MQKNYGRMLFGWLLPVDKTLSQSIACHNALKRLEMSIYSVFLKNKSYFSLVGICGSQSHDIQLEIGQECSAKLVQLTREKQ